MMYSFLSEQTQQGYNMRTPARENKQEHQNTAITEKKQWIFRERI